MSGRRSERPRRRPVAVDVPDGIAPYADRPVIRVSNLYATSWRAQPGQAGHTALPECLSFGRLEQFYQASADQWPWPTLAKHNRQ